MGNKLGTARKLRSRALDLHDKGDLAAAANTMSEAVELTRTSLGKQHRDTGEMVKLLAMLHEEAGAFALALEGYREALAVHIVCGTAVQIADGHNRVGMCLAAVQKPHEALPYVEEAVRVIRVWNSTCDGLEQSVKPLATTSKKKGLSLSARSRARRHLRCRQGSRIGMRTSSLRQDEEAGEDDGKGGPRASAQRAGRRRIRTQELRQSVVGGARVDTITRQTTTEEGESAGGGLRGSNGPDREGGDVDCEDSELIEEGEEWGASGEGRDNEEIEVGGDEEDEDKDEDEDEEEEEDVIREDLLVLYLNHNADVREMVGGYRVAATLRKEALDITRELFGTTEEQLRYQIEQLVRSLVRTKDFDGAASLARESFDKEKQRVGFDAPAVMFWANLLSFVYRSGKDYERAAKMLEEGVKLCRVEFGEGEETAMAVSELGLLYQEMGRLEKAMVLFQEALALRLELFGREDSETCRALSRLGRVLMLMQDFGKAAQYFREVLAMTRSRVGDAHPETADALYDLGSVFVKSGQFVKAAPVYEEALAIYYKEEAIFSCNDPRIPQVMLELGAVYEDLGDVPKACDMVEEALQLSRSCLGAEHDTTGRAIESMEHLYTVLGRYKDALILSVESLALKRASAAVRGKKPTAGVQWALTSLGLLYMKLEKFSLAERVLEEALAVATALERNRLEETMAVMAHLALAYHWLGKRKRAVEMGTNALEICRAEAYDRDGMACASYCVGTLLAACSQHLQAAELLEHAASVWRRLGDKESLATCLKALACVLEKAGEVEKAREAKIDATAAEEAHTASLGICTTE